MKLLLFIGSLSTGGAERVSATLANYWCSKGWEVTIVTVAKMDKDFYQLDPAVQRISLNMAQDSGNLASSVINNLRRLASLYRLLISQKPDTAIAMMPASNVTLALAGWLAGIRTIGSERNYPPLSPIGRLWGSARRLTYPLLSALVAQTNDIALWLRANAPTERITVIPNPVSIPLTKQPPLISPSTVRTKLTGSHVILGVGRLVEQKRFDKLIHAFAEVAPKYPNWSLVILGEGNQRVALSKLTEKLGLTSRVALPGRAGNIGEWYAIADIYAMTSHFEGFPNTLLEALAHGLPSLAVNCKTGPSELIQSNFNGLLVPQDDFKALVSELDRLMGSPKLRARLSSKAKEARDTYAVHHVAEQWESLIRDLDFNNDEWGRVK